MLPELILREEEHRNYPLLMLLGFASGTLGFIAAKFLFPSQVDVLSVIFASLPLVFPLMSFFLEREEDLRKNLPEVEVYSSIFIGEVSAFLLLASAYPSAFELQMEAIGLTGNAVSNAALWSILGNNLIVFTGIFLASALIGSAGAFILTWNASVMGVFFADLMQSSVIKPLAYVPHATLEISGFIVAGVSGSMVSAAVYREHFEREAWKNYLQLVLIGVLLIVLAAVIETA